MILVLSKVVTTPQFLHEKSFICLSAPREGTRLSQSPLLLVAIGPEAACALRAGKLPVRTKGVRRVLAVRMLDFSTKKASICSQISILRNNFVELEAASPIYLSA